MSDLDNAVTNLKAGRLPEAEEACRRYLGEKPEHPIALHVMAEICRAAGRAEEAHGWLEAAVRIPEPTVAAWNFLGRSHWDRGEVDAAIDAFDAACTLRLTDSLAQDNLAAALAARGRPDDRFLVTVVTATRGGKHLAQAIRSVQDQSYPNIEHLVVADGPDVEQAVRVQIPADPRHPVHLLPLPCNTGANGFNGHRIYAASMFLAQGRYIAFLDDDNWFEPDHIALMMERITTQGLQWAHALRAIVDPEGRPLGHDDCASLGRWPLWHDSEKYLVDVNCYLLRRDVALRYAPLWHRRYRDEVPPDCVMCGALLKDYPKFDCTRRYTVNYRVENSPLSMTRDFFHEGNARMKERYPDGFPWLEEPNK